MPEISVVLPCHNGERFLRESLESVRKQTFRDWELIIVDDGSADGSPKIAQSYAELDPRIRVIRNGRNRGLPESLNIGFRAATGRYLTWTSDDNLYLSGALAAMYGYLEAHADTAMVCAGMLWIDEEKHYLREQPVYDDAAMCVQDYVGACFLYRSEVAATIGEYRREQFCVEDYDYWLRILKRYGHIGYLPGAYYLYRSHGASLTATRRWEIWEKDARLIASNCGWILPRLAGRKELLTILYGKLLFIGCGDWNEALLRQVPELRFEREPEPGKPIILYGTGETGRAAREKLGDRAAAFTRSYGGGGGETKYGLPVLPLEEAIALYRTGGYQFLVSAGTDAQFQIITELLQRGVQRYSMFGRLGPGREAPA